MRAHHASPMSAALAASPQTSGFQDIHSCLSFVGWHRSCVPSWRMYAGYRHWPLSSAVCWQSNVLGQEITQPVRWPLFCHRRANGMEQSAWTASATGHHLRTIQMIVENVYVWLVGPRRPVSQRYGLWLEIFLLTYLLNYLAARKTEIKQFDYITVVEDRPIMSVKYCLPVPCSLLLLAKTIINAPCSAVSLR